MKIFFDTEFIEDGKTIDLISIGMVRSTDGATYYAESNEVDWTKSNDFVDKHVKPHLTGGIALKSRAIIKQEIIEFCGFNPEFWAWYSSYDWVALAQLHGRMVDLPNHWPMYCNDFKQVIELSEFVNTYHSRKLIPEKPINNHNALDDALWLKKYYDLYMEKYQINKSNWLYDSSPSL